ncbi:hypothetical protein [Pedobacter endophyticus]|uniref:Uncharacterized protein n=1 Tax=Pedobacter endophyticus TaxID=2789740 RepID=A0A7S9PZP1_9SPHI|nr:hypothetical protein [Pedobacter endophyticus]QPH40553.1 hypothetical protein IZT61_04535 [Pedobacter endophyticus]
MLKQVNLGLVALVLGFGLTIVSSAFKGANTSANKRVQYTFNYTYSGSDPFSVANVTDPGHWAYAPDSEGCSGEQKACTIRIDEDYVDLSATPTLKSTASLTAALDPSTNTAYITGSADDFMSIENSDQP